MKPDLSAVINFHREGYLAHRALNAYSDARETARKHSTETEFILVLDRSDELTRSIVAGHPALDGSEKILEISVGDLALARNAGIDACSADITAIMDGDDVVSRNYFYENREQVAAAPKNIILHPEIVVSFGMYTAFNWQVDQEGQFFDRAALLTVNPWISANCARTEVYRKTPYLACFPRTTGFGFEDWHWNCETIASGYVHRIAMRTLYCYRRKVLGSLNEASQHLRAVAPRSTYFDSPLSSAAE